MDCQYIHNSLLRPHSQDQTTGRVRLRIRYDGPQLNFGSCLQRCVRGISWERSQRPSLYAAVYGSRAGE